MYGTCNQYVTVIGIPVFLALTAQSVIVVTGTPIIHNYTWPYFYTRCIVVVQLIVMVRAHFFGFISVEGHTHFLLYYVATCTSTHAFYYTVFNRASY